MFSTGHFILNFLEVAFTKHKYSSGIAQKIKTVIASWHVNNDGIFLKEAQ